MLLCDGKPVNLKSLNGPGKFAGSKIKEIKDKIKFPARFIFPDEYKARVMRYDKANKTRTPSHETSQGVAVPLTKNYKSDTGALESWTYYESSVQKEKMTKYYPRNHKLTFMSVFNEGNIELLFFLIYISGHCENIKGLTGQSTAKKRTYMILQDPAASAIKAGDRRRAETKVSNMLYDPDIIDEDALRILAKSYYIQDVDNIDELDILRDRIFSIVTKSTDKESVEKFLARASMDDQTQIQALITEAIDKRVIFEKKNPTGPSAWKFLDADGKEGTEILTLLPGDRSKKTLSAKLLRSKDIADTIRKEIKRKDNPGSNDEPED